MLVVIKGLLKHDGETFGPGQPLPKMSRKEADRLLKLGVVREVAEAARPVPKAPAVPPTAPVADPDPPAPPEDTVPPADVNLNFDPDEAIKAKA